jgi:hypothetical protein
VNEIKILKNEKTEKKYLNVIFLFFIFIFSEGKLSGFSREISVQLSGRLTGKFEKLFGSFLAGNPMFQESLKSPS